MVGFNFPNFTFYCNWLKNFPKNFIYGQSLDHLVIKYFLNCFCQEIKKHYFKKTFQGYPWASYSKLFGADLKKSPTYFFPAGNFINCFCNKLADGNLKIIQVKTRFFRKIHYLFLRLHLGSLKIIDKFKICLAILLDSSCKVCLIWNFNL